MPKGEFDRSERRARTRAQLLEAAARLRARGLPAKLLFIGAGPTRTAIEERSRAAGLGEHLRITGFREDIRPLVSACDVMCVCRLTEALSLAAIEAMAMARPVVHSQVGGVAELIESGMTRDEAYRTVQESAQKAWDTGTEFRELIGEAAPQLDLDEVFDYGAYTQHVPDLIARLDRISN